MFRSVVWAGLLVGCVSASGDGWHPLFADPADASGKGVAKLMGDVESVDGKSVSEHGHRFLLTPGCHTVTNLTTWGGSSADGAVMAKLPQIPFRIDMQAGYTYVLRIGVDREARMEGAQLSVTAVEQDENGQVTRQFKPGTKC